MNCLQTVIRLAFPHFVTGFPHCVNQNIHPDRHLRIVIMSMKKNSLLAMIFVLSGIQLMAQDQRDTAALKEEAMPQVVVVGYKDKLLSKVPGSVSVLRFKDIQSIAPLSGNDVVKRVPGLNVVDEEGAGLRINIGVRGLDPDRSRNVLILEDGVPVALNPYGEPEMYFTPVIDKVRSIEVLKEAVR